MALDLRRPLAEPMSATRPEPPANPPERMSRAQKATWRMPQLTLLRPVQWSVGTKFGMLGLRAYLVAGAVLLVVKAVRIGTR